jgi:gamma-glutamylcyclotransferase (GGCT)/AIG2-like uncharacterized protein YtfP
LAKSATEKWETEKCSKRSIGAKEKTVSECLFVYGTLRPSFAPPELKELIGQWRKVGDGYVHGRLYDLGEYPGAVLDSASETRIIGEVFELPDDDSTLAALDSYEGFDPGNLNASLFVRRRCEVMFEDDSKIECWVYVYNRRVTPSTIIQSGDVLMRYGERERSEPPGGA